MAVFFSSTFRSGPSGDSTALKRYNLFIAQQKANNEAGVITDPSIYEQGIETYLRPFADDLEVAKAIANATSEKKQLMDRLNDESLKKKTLETDVQENMFNIGKQNFKDPGTVILKTTTVYDAYLGELEEEIGKRMRNGQSYSQLLTVREQVEEKVRSLGELSRSYMAGTTGREDVNAPSAPKTGYGFFVKTNPQTGKIVNFTLEPVEGNTPKGFYKTDSFYGGVPVYVNAVRDPNKENNLYGKVGNSTYQGSFEEFNVDDQASTLKVKTLKLQNPKELDLDLGESVANVFRMGDKQKKFDAERGAYDVDLSDVDFEKAINMPRNSFGKDRDGNFYYLDFEGKFYRAANPKTIADQIGVTEDEVKSQAYYLTTSDLRDLSTLQSTGPKQITASSTPMSASSGPQPLLQVGAVTQQNNPTTTPSNTTSTPQQVDTSTADKFRQARTIKEKNEVIKNAQVTKNIVSGGLSALDKAGDFVKKGVGGVTKFIKGL